MWSIERVVDGVVAELTPGKTGEWAIVSVVHCGLRCMFVKNIMKLR